MYIHTPGWHTIYFITCICVSVTWWCRRRSSQRWRSRRRCCRLWWRCAGACAPPEFVRIFRCTISAGKTAICVIVINHCRVSFRCRLHHFMHRKLNCSLFLFSDLSARFFNWLLPFPNCAAQKPPSGHLGHIQGKGQVGLF